MSYPEDNVEERRYLLGPKIYFHSTQAVPGRVHLQTSDKAHESASHGLAVLTLN